MHAVLAVAHIHDLTFNDSYASKGVGKLSPHWYRAVSLLNHRLSQPIIPAERDAIWLAATLISIGGFVAIEADIPDQAWPLRPPSALDLSWLKLCDGKRHVAKLTDPLREDGAFHRVAAEMLETITDLEHTFTARPQRWEGLPDGFFEVFELHKDPKDNPYYEAVAAMVEISRFEASPDNFLRHISFSSVFDEGFRQLLIMRDERSLLVLLYWYAKMCDRRLWWIWRHSWTEGLAICAYLDRAWIRSPDLAKLVDCPRNALIEASGYSKYSKMFPVAGR